MTQAWPQAQPAFHLISLDLRRLSADCESLLGSLSYIDSITRLFSEKDVTGQLKSTKREGLHEEQPDLNTAERWELKRE